MSQPRPERCGGCNGKVQITTTDATDYAWFCWGVVDDGKADLPLVPGTWKVLVVESTVEEKLKLREQKASKKRVPVFKL